MRILHAITSIDPQGGGPVEYIRQISRVLAAHGCDSEVVCTDSPQAPYIDRFPVPVYALGPATGRYGYCAALGPWLAQNDSRYDAVLVHGLWGHIGLAASRALNTTPYFVFPHGMLDPWCVRRDLGTAIKKQTYWCLAEHRVLRKARAVLFTTEQERLRSRRSVWPYRITEAVVQLGTSLPDVVHTEAKELFLARFPALRGHEVLLYLSRLDPKKGLDLLVPAFVRSARYNPQIHLAIVGPENHEFRFRLENSIRFEGKEVLSRITWCGPLFDRMKWGAFCAADAFVLPSHQENFGFAVAEALGAGLPVLISDKINICDPIRNAGAGFVESDDEAGTERLVARWSAASNAERLRMRENASKCFHAHFTVEAAAASLFEMLRQFGVAAASHFSPIQLTAARPTGIAA